MSHEKKWIVSLGDGTWVMMDGRPIVILMAQAEIDKLDEAPIDCTRLTHMHIKDLVELSHWADHSSTIENYAHPDDWPL